MSHMHDRINVIGLTLEFACVAPVTGAFAV
jgi:hypothetical protein